MGSYTAPAFSLGYNKALTDNTNALNDVILGPITCVDFFVNHKKTALWDGQITLQVQLEDDSWTDIIAYGQFTSSPLAQHIDPDFNVLANLDYKYPFIWRVKVTLAATVGACTIWFIASPGPANPLF